MVAVTEEVARLKKEQKEAVNSLEKSLAGTRTELDALRGIDTKICRLNKLNKRERGRNGIVMKCEIR